MSEDAHRIKISRKALKAPDEFQSLTARAIDWAEGHRTALAAVAVALGILAVALVGLGRYRGARMTAAGSAFRAARVQFDAGKYTDAASAFAAVRDEHDGTVFAGLAVLYRGHALARGGDTAGAAVAYEEYLAGGAEDDCLRQEALTALGHVRETGGDVTGALDAYMKAGGMPGPFRHDALLGVARGHEVAGHGEQAREVYVKLLAENPDPETRQLVRSKMPAGSVPADRQ